MLAKRIYQYLKRLPNQWVSRETIKQKADYNWRDWKNATDMIKEKAVDIAVEYRDKQEYYMYIPMDPELKKHIREGLRAFESWK